MIMLLWTLFLMQEVFTHQQSGLNFELPAGWTYTQVGDHFEATSPNEDVTLLFFVGNETEAEAAADEAAETLDEIFSNVNITLGPEIAEVNGLTQVYLEGDGTMEGVRMDWDLTIVCGNRKAMVIVGLGDIEGMQRVVDGIYASVAQ